LKKQIHALIYLINEIGEEIIPVAEIVRESPLLRNLPYNDKTLGSVADFLSKEDLLEAIRRGLELFLRFSSRVRLYKPDRTKYFEHVIELRKYEEEEKELRTIWDIEKPSEEIEAELLRAIVIFKLRIDLLCKDLPKFLEKKLKKLRKVGKIASYLRDIRRAGTLKKSTKPLAL